MAVKQSIVIASVLLLVVFIEQGEIIFMHMQIGLNENETLWATWFLVYLLFFGRYYHFGVEFSLLAFLCFIISFAC